MNFRIPWENIHYKNRGPAYSTISVKWVMFQSNSECRGGVRNHESKSTDIESRDMLSILANTLCQHSHADAGGWIIGIKRKNDLWINKLKQICRSGGPTTEKVRGFSHKICGSSQFRKKPWGSVRCDSFTSENVIYSTRGFLISQDFSLSLNSRIYISTPDL